MGLPPGERDRQAFRRAQVSPLGHVDEPSLVDDTGGRQPLQPRRVHERRHVVPGDQVTGQRVELAERVVGSRLPVSRPANP